MAAATRRCVQPDYFRREGNDLVGNTYSKSSRLDATEIQYAHLRRIQSWWSAASECMAADGVSIQHSQKSKRATKFHLRVKKGISKSHYTAQKDRAALHDFPRSNRVSWQSSYKDVIRPFTRRSENHMLACRKFHSDLNRYSPQHDSSSNYASLSTVPTESISDEEFRFIKRDSGEDGMLLRAEVVSRAKLCTPDEIDTLLDVICILDEPNVELFDRVVHRIGSQRTMQTLEETLEIEQNGGKKTQTGERKAPGGVFLSCLKSCLSKEELRFIWDEQTQWRKARRRLCRNNHKKIK